MDQEQRRVIRHLKPNCAVRQMIFPQPQPIIDVVIKIGQGLMGPEDQGLSFTAGKLRPSKGIPEAVSFLIITDGHAYT